jgi:triosephosphate isomerase
MRRKIVAGNWKLHGDRAFAKSLAGGIAATPAPAGVERVVMPPFPYLAELAWQFAGKGVELGAQDVSEHDKGAYTGEVAASMLADIGVRDARVGQYERRQ